MADVQFRLFTAQVSHAYLTALSQPPTPSRNKSNTPSNVAAELKTLQTEIDVLVSNCEEATRLLARQSVMNQVSETLSRGRVEKMERELDGVERIENSLEDMIGRMTIARDLILFEMSKLDALNQVSCQLDKVGFTTQSKTERGPQKSKEREVVNEIATLQNLIGVGNADDLRKIMFKWDRLDKELFDSTFQNVKVAMGETYISPLIN